MLRQAVIWGLIKYRKLHGLIVSVLARSAAWQFHMVTLEGMKHQESCSQRQYITEGNTTVDKCHVESSLITGIDHSSGKALACQRKRKRVSWNGMDGISAVRRQIQSVVK